MNEVSEAGTNPAPSQAPPTKHGRRSPAMGEQTRAELVEAAEKLFSLYGFDGVSIRKINNEAGLAAAAAHYHFGTKRHLLDAVVDRLNDPVREQYERTMLGWRQQHHVPSVSEFLLAYLKPVVTLIRDDPARAARWIKIMAALPPEYSRERWPNMMMESFAEQMFPQLDSSAARLRIRIAAGTMLYIMSFMPTGATESEHRGRRTQILLAFQMATGGLTETSLKPDEDLMNALWTH